MVRPGYWYYTYYTVRVSYPVPYLYNVWVPGYKLWGFIPIPGHNELRLGIRWVTSSYRIPIPHYVPPKIGVYYTYIRTPDLPVIRLPSLSSSKTSKTVVVHAATHPVENYYEHMEPIGEVRERSTGGLTFSEMTPEQQERARKQTQQARSFLKGVFMTSVGVGMFVSPIFVPFLASIAPFTSTGGPIVIHSGLHLMSEVVPDVLLK